MFGQKLANDEGVESCKFRGDRWSLPKAFLATESHKALDSGISNDGLRIQLGVYTRTLQAHLDHAEHDGRGRLKNMFGKVTTENPILVPIFGTVS